MLRILLVIIGAAAVVAGLFFIAGGGDTAAGIYLIIMGAILVVALLIERRGYRPTVDRSSGHWEATGERFVDPTSGHLIEVRYNPETGERDYVDTGEAN